MINEYTEMEKEGITDKKSFAIIQHQYSKLRRTVPISDWVLNALMTFFFFFSVRRMESQKHE